MTVVRGILIFLIVVLTIAFVGASILLLGGVYGNESIEKVADGIADITPAQMIEYGAIGTVASGAALVIVFSILSAKIV